MKLFEFAPVVKKFNSDKEFDMSKYKRMHAEQISSSSTKSGQHGRVYSTNEPDKIVKRGHSPRPEDMDGYRAYIEAVANSGMSGKNPFLPKVYDLKIVKDAKGLSHYRAKIETLVDFTAITRDEIKAATVALFDATDINYVRKISRKYNENADERDQYILVYLIEAVILGSVKSKNPQLSQACKLIHKVLHSGPHYGCDLNMHNVMYRKSGTFVIPVIIDPLDETPTKAA